MDIEINPEDCKRHEWRYLAPAVNGLNFAIRQDIEKMAESRMCKFCGTHEVRRWVIVK